MQTAKDPSPDPDPATLLNLFGTNPPILQCTPAQFSQYPAGPVFTSGRALIVPTGGGPLAVFSWGQRLEVLPPAVATTYALLRPAEFDSKAIKLLSD